VTDRLLPEGLLEIMQCIRCGGALTERAEPPSLVCARCAVWYPVEDGIPVMLDEEIRPLEGSEAP
jgi:uncharacterized protein YbaR (Trm112 family)